jgi:hypothetical protein
MDVSSEHDPFVDAIPEGNLLLMRRWMSLWKCHMHPTPLAIKDAFQKKVRNERRERRTVRKRAARVAASPSIVEHQPTDTVQ